MNEAKELVEAIAGRIAVYMGQEVGLTTCDLTEELIALVAQAIAEGKIKLPREIWRADYDGYLCDWTIDGSLDNTTPEIEEPIRRWQGRLIALGP